VKIRLTAAALLFLVSGTGMAAPRAPIIDMHMHALAANDQGPPPMGMCTPIVSMPVWDQRRPYAEQFMERFKHPPCKDPVWSPMTDEALMRDTLAVMSRLNIIGVVSGTPERVAAWRKAGGERIIPAVEFSLQPELDVARLSALHSAGGMEVLGEVDTQYAGVAPTDPRLEPY
jgi:hypothetical protein